MYYIFENDDPIIDEVVPVKDAKATADEYREKVKEEKNKLRKAYGLGAEDSYEVPHMTFLDWIERYPAPTQNDPNRKQGNAVLLIGIRLGLTAIAWRVKKMQESNKQYTNRLETNFIHRSRAPFPVTDTRYNADEFFKKLPTASYFNSYFKRINDSNTVDLRTVKTGETEKSVAEKNKEDNQKLLLDIKATFEIPTLYIELEKAIPNEIVIKTLARSLKTSKENTPTQRLFDLCSKTNGGIVALLKISIAFIQSKLEAKKDGEDLEELKRNRNFLIEKLNYFAQIAFASPELVYDKTVNIENAVSIKERDLGFSSTFLYKEFAIRRFNKIMNWGIKKLEELDKEYTEIVALTDNEQLTQRYKEIIGSYKYISNIKEKEEDLSKENDTDSNASVLTSQ
jgi:hypothetical protein